MSATTASRSDWYAVYEDAVAPKVMQLSVTVNAGVAYVQFLHLMQMNVFCYAPRTSDRIPCRYDLAFVCIAYTRFSQANCLTAIKTILTTF